MSLSLDAVELDPAAFANWAVELELAAPPVLTVAKTLQVAALTEGSLEKGRRLNAPAPGRIDSHIPGEDGDPWIWLDAAVDGARVTLRAEEAEHAEIVRRAAAFLLVYGPGRVLSYAGAPSRNSDLHDVRAPTPPNGWGTVPRADPAK